MRKIIPVIIVFAVCLSFIGMWDGEKASAADSQALPFSDISKHWAKDNILKAYESGLVEGFPDGTFRPDDVVQADQFIVMMLRAHSVTENGETKFDPKWYEELNERQPGHLHSIMLAVYKNKFDFKPAKTGYWAKPFVDFIYETPFLVTWDEVFPKEYDVYKKQITREEASYLLGSWFARFENDYQRLYEEFVNQHSGLKDFNDFTQSISGYRTEMLISGIMNGYPNKYFYPQRYVTRAEALTMVLRLRDASLRKPYEPDLTGQYYTNRDGEFYLYTDKFKYDTYKEYINLAKKHLGSGYINYFGGSSLRIYKTEEDYKKYDYMTRSGQYENRPIIEVSPFISEDYNTVGINFSKIMSHTDSQNYLLAIFDLLAGNGKGNELKIIVDGLIHTGTEKEFIFNNKNFKFYITTNNYVLEQYY